MTNSYCYKIDFSLQERDFFFFPPFHLYVEFSTIYAVYLEIHILSFFLRDKNGQSKLGNIKA